MRCVRRPGRPFRCPSAEPVRPLRAPSRAGHDAARSVTEAHQGYPARVDLGPCAGGPGDNPARQRFARVTVGPVLGDRLVPWTSPWWVLVGVGALTGAGVGHGIRCLLGRLRRGAVLGPGGVEIACALLTAASLAAGWGTPRLPILLWAGWLGVALAAVDLRHHRLPDALTLPAWGISAALVLGTAVWAPGSGSILRAFIAAAVVGGLFWLTWRVAPRAMGRGDVKLVPALVLLTGYLSWTAAVLGVVLAFVSGAVVSLAGLLTGRMTMRSALAFGPHLLAGCWLALAIPAWSAGL